MSQLTLITNSVIYSDSSPLATALLIDGAEIAWIGDHEAARGHMELADTIIDAGGHFVAPGFVDAHVHATSTGLMLGGLDLTQVTHKNELLKLLSDYAKHVNGATILGHGWDQSNWADPQLPTRAEIDRATWGSVVYLSRIDVHSALVSNSLIAQCPEVKFLAGYGEGVVTQLAHGALRKFALGSISHSQRKTAQELFLDHCLSQGIVGVHEMAGPHISSYSDASSLQELSSGSNLPQVAIYWGELLSEDSLNIVRELKAIGAAGDLFIDGAIGSHTAFLKEPYSDDPQNTGAGYLTAEQVADHLRACTEAGIQGGFHVIGDQACEIALTGARIAAGPEPDPEFHSLRHRLEHAEMLSESGVKELGKLGMTASMQPLFDAWWGNPGGMYESRLGTRAHQMNRWGSLQADGAAVCFSSDSPVTPNTPWTAVHAAMYHQNPQERISADAAFAAHSRSGWRALGAHFDSHGVIEVGAPAHLAIWHVQEFEDGLHGSRLAQRGAQPRTAAVPLPDLGSSIAPEIPANMCTIVNGAVSYTEENFADRISTYAQ
ncbi:MAG: amidohydrolase [Candidatus Nanopelagicales bacterium]|jgi:predicted amidohydrolase YtcJ